jgi:2-polyprenyl-3-methyl-5-hydroxy-6-metoxy-1,4-benzoquinol methylase
VRRQPERGAPLGPIQMPATLPVQQRFILLAELSQNKRFTLCDIDPRALSLAQQIHGSQLVGVDAVAANAPLPYVDAQFDAVISMDVVEHVVDPPPWVQGALRVLKPGGLLFLTTPNYASYSLRALESTVLEVIARKQGFSRRSLRPSKLDPRKLAALLEHAGAKQAVIKPISFGWALAAFARR